MRNVKTISAGLLLSGLLLGMNLSAQTEADKHLEKILLSIRSADIETLSTYLNDMVELTVPGSEGTYSNTQAKFLLKDFFKKHPPLNIQVKHEGSSNKGSRFAICHYKHKSGKYRLYYLIKEKNNKYLIHILRFENI